MTVERSSYLIRDNFEFIENCIVYILNGYFKYQNDCLLFKNVKDLKSY